MDPKFGEKNYREKKKEEVKSKTNNPPENPLQ